jgi:hypothetical protein
MSTRLIESDGDAIVIDLDHTLICSKKEYIADVPVIDFPDTRYYVHVRPGVKSFIDYLLKQDYTIILTIIDDSDYAIDPSDTHRWIKIPRFYGDPNDNVLEALKPLF